MMVRIAQPDEGMTVYDPCSGSGGMLVLSKEYLDEHQKNAKNLRLFGQESNGGVWAISKMNMLLQLDSAIHKLDEPEARDLVLGILRGHLDAMLSRFVASHRIEVVAAIIAWWDKYQVTLSAVETERAAAQARLAGFLRELGYGSY